ncbi:hypothetical protein [Caulobacter mirabilis]|nr:hypothetical protein [Caulobacter mirabilis]
MSILHWLAVLLFVPLVVGMIVSVCVILRKAGFSRWWAIVAFIPYVNIVGLFVFAFVRWPSLEARAQSPD